MKNKDAGWGASSIDKKKTPPPKVYVCMPSYDTMHTATCLSLIKLFDSMTASGIKMNISTFKCPYVGYGRNILAALFLDSNYDYLLFVDADVQFEPDAVARMLVTKKDYICTPYRKKTEDISVKYSVAFEDKNNINVEPFGIAKIAKGPAGLTLIHRRVFEKLMKLHPDLKIKHFNGIPKDVGDKYLFNFFDTDFDPKIGLWEGEDVRFCNLTKAAGFDMWANLNSEVVHYGTYGYAGKFGDSLTKKKNGSGL